MRTTVEIPDTLFRQIKARAALDGMKMKELVASLLEIGLHQPIPARLKPGSGLFCPFPLFHGKGGPLMKRMSGKVVAALETEEALARYRRSSGY